MLFKVVETHSFVDFSDSRLMCQSEQFKFDVGASQDLALSPYPEESAKERVVDLQKGIFRNRSTPEG
jgi:hypothetical protein